MAKTVIKKKAGRGPAKKPTLASKKKVIAKKTTKVVKKPVKKTVKKGTAAAKKVPRKNAKKVVKKTVKAKKIQKRPKSPTKKASKKTLDIGKMQKAPIFEVRKIFEKEYPQVQLSKEAAEVLNDLLIETFTSIASKAVQICKKADDADMSVTDVRKIIRGVMKETNPPRNK